MLSKAVNYVSDDLQRLIIKIWRYYMRVPSPLAKVL